MPRSQHHRVLTGSDPGALASASLISRPHRSPPCPSKMCLGYRPHSPSQSISFSSLLLPLYLGFPLPSTRTLIGAPATPRCRTQRSTCRPHLMCWWPSHRGVLLLLKPSWFGIQVPGHLASCGCCWSQLIFLPWGSPKPPLESALPQRADVAWAQGTSQRSTNALGWTPDSRPQWTDPLLPRVLLGTPARHSSSSLCCPGMLSVGISALAVAQAPNSVASLSTVLHLHPHQVCLHFRRVQNEAREPPTPPSPGPHCYSAHKAGLMPAFPLKQQPECSG